MAELAFAVEPGCGEEGSAGRRALATRALTFEVDPGLKVATALAAAPKDGAATLAAEGAAAPVRAADADAPPEAIDALASDAGGCSGAVLLPVDALAVDALAVDALAAVG